MTIFFIVCVLLFTSCSGHSPGNFDTEIEVPIIRIEPPPNNLPPLLLSEIADSIHYVALETNKNCLISSGVGYSIDSGFVFLQGPLLFFSRNGKFLNTIGRIGKGPEEYIPTSGTVVDGDNGLAYVRNRGNPYTFVVYSLEGKYIKTVKNQFIADGARAAMFDSAIVMVYPVADKRHKRTPDIVVYNTALDTITLSKTIDYNLEYDNNPSHRDFSTALCFSAHPKHVYYKTTYDDTLYLIKKEKISRALVIDFGRHSYSKENIYGNKFMNMKELFRNTVRLSKMRCLGNKFYFNCVYTNETDQTTGFMYVCDIKGENGQYFQSVFTNDLDEGPNYRFPDWGNITSIYLDDIDDQNEPFYFPNNKMSKKMKNKDQFSKLYQKAKESDNPIIQVIHFK